MVTFAAALEKGLITPTTVLNVDGSINVGDITVHDAWAHGPINMTATGILAKSSNVGTLMIAQKLGEKAFYSELQKFGLGQKTGIELSEDRGVLPAWNADKAKSQWTSSTFASYPGFRPFPYKEYSEVFFGPDYRVLRGGSWATDATACRSTFRNWDYPMRRQIFAGFRCARDAAPGEGV